MEDPVTENPLPLQNIPEPQTPRDPVWNGWDVAMIAVVALVLTGVTIGIAGRLLGYTTKTDSTRVLRLTLIAQTIGYCAGIWFMWNLVRQYRSRWDDAVHWRWPVANWFAWIGAGIMLSVGVQLLSGLLPLPRTLPIDKYFQTTQAAWMMSIFGISMAPLFEELFFRGFLYPVLARRAGIVIGAILTAMGFALLHTSQLAGAWAPLLMLFFVGLVLTAVRIVKNAVAPSFLMHVGYNLTLFTLVWIKTDHFQHMEKLLQQ